MDTGPRGTRKYDYSPKKCEICGRTFERQKHDRGSTWAKRRFCSRTCANEDRRRKYWNARPERTCPICGEKFRTKHKLKFAVTCGKDVCKRRYKLEVAAPKTAAAMRAAYASGERPKVRGISPREQILWPLLISHGWEWRHRWFDEWGCFELDFSKYHERLAVEIDGPEHHWPKHREKDEIRDAELIRRGWKILRIPNSEVDASPEDVAKRILAWSD